MAIQILSDLHLEAPKGYDTFEIIPSAPYLALIGDIGNIVKHKDDCFAFFTQQLRQFRVVLFVPGNHEAYHSNWKDTLLVLREFEDQVRNNSSLGDFILLDRSVFRVPEINTVILGCSLFSHVPSASHMAVSMGLNDFYHIEEWDVETHSSWHSRDLAWLNETVAGLEGEDVKVVVLTHWSPSTDARAVDPRHTQSPIRTAFSTDLSGEVCFRSAKVRVWAFGHTHYNCDFEVERDGGVGPLRIVTNQRGYYFAQAEGFDGGKTVEP